jgi:hypothetical protein
VPIKTVSLFTYRTGGGTTLWTPPQLGVLRFKEALKGEAVGAASSIRVCGRMCEMGPKNRAQAFEYFGEMALEVLEDELATSRVILVPVPDSKSTLTTAACRTAKMANALAAESEAIVADVLRWEAAHTPARRGGDRAATVLYTRLRMRGTIPIHGRPFVLIDDFTASGGHIRACAAYLRARGADVRLAICAGKTDTPPADVFERRIDNYEDLVVPSER